MGLQRARYARLLLIAVLCASGLRNARQPPAHAQVGATQTSASPTNVTSFWLHWVMPALTTPTVPPRVTSVAFDPLTPGLALAGPGNMGSPIQRSTDHGMTWSPLPSWNPSNPQGGYSIAYGQQKGAFIAYGVASVYRTADGGDSWTSLPYPPGCTQIRTLLVHPGDPQLLYVSTMYGLARSLDGGATWNDNMFVPGSCFAGPAAYALAASVTAPQTIYAGAAGVHQSTDGGVTWRDVSGNLPSSGGSYQTIRGLVADQRTVDTLYALTDDGRVYRTADAGGVWSWISAGLGDTRVVSIYLAQPEHRLYAVSEQALYALEDGASAWQAVPADRIPQVASQPDTLAIVVDPASATRVVGAGQYGIYVTVELKSSVALPLVIK